MNSRTKMLTKRTGISVGLVLSIIAGTNYAVQQVHDIAQREAETSAHKIEAKLDGVLYYVEKLDAKFDILLNRMSQAPYRHQPTSTDKTP